MWRIINTEKSLQAKLLRQKAGMSFKKQLDAILGEIEYWKGYALMDQMTFILSPKSSPVLIILMEKYFSSLASSNVSSYLNYSPYQFTAEDSHRVTKIAYWPDTIPSVVLGDFFHRDKSDLLVQEAWL